MRTCHLAIAALGLALFVATSPARAQAPDCDNLDPSTIDTSDPTSLVALLPCSGWDATCQNAVASAGASCFQDITAIQTYLNNSGLLPDPATAVPEGGNATEAAMDAAANVTVDAASEQVDKLLPEIQKALSASDGKLSALCCSGIDPVISAGCLCEQKPVELLGSFLGEGQSPEDFFPLVKKVMDGLGCPAFDNAKLYPNC